MLSVPMFSLQVYDRVLGSGSQDTLLALVLIVAFALTALGLLETVRTSVLARLSTRLGSRLSPMLLAAGAQAGDPGQGLRDLTQLRQTLSGPALTAIFDAPWLPIALGLVWLLHPELGYFGLVSAILLGVLAVTGDLVARRRLKDANVITPRAQRQVEALGRQREVVTAMGLLPHLQARFARLHDQVLILQQRASERGGMVSGVARSARLMIQAGVMGLGALLVLKGELTSGGMIASSILLSRALAPIEQMLAGLAIAGPGLRVLAEAAGAAGARPSREGRPAAAATGRRGDAGPGHLHRRRAPDPEAHQLRDRAGRVPRRRRTVRCRQEHAVPVADRRAQAVLGHRAAGRRRHRDAEPVGPRTACRLPPAAYRPVRRHGGREHRPVGA